MRIRIRSAQPSVEETPERKNLEAFLGQKPQPATQQQIKGITRKIQSRLADAVDEAKPLGLKLDAAFFRELLLHLIQEARQPDYAIPNDGSIRAYLMASIFQELIQMPSNIFDRVTAADGTDNYIPLTVETWIAALEAAHTSTIKSA